MGREVRRVPADFAWPINTTWSGFVNPHHPRQCASCAGSGESPDAKRFHEEWYGNAPFDPASTGSKPHGPTHPRIVAMAQRNVGQAQWCGPVDREAKRLARDCFDSHWSHHLGQADVDALVEAGRLMDFTHTWSRETRWAKKEPPYIPTAAEVNEWSIGGMAHDSVNAWVCIKARCAREGVPHLCATCNGDGTDPTDSETIALCEAWEQTEPPSGEAWQIWETVSEGSPITPALETPEDLARWCEAHQFEGAHRAGWNRLAGGEDALDYAQWLAFIHAGWAPSMMGNGVTLTSGVEFVAAMEGPAEPAS